jgi:hypothetical protein
MTREPQPDPTHVLVSSTTDDAGVEADATTAAVAAVLDHADSVTLWVDTTLLSDDHPALARRLREATTSTGEKLRAPVEDVREPLSDLLSLRDFHRSVSLERLDAVRDGEQLLSYVPDHSQFRLDVEPVPELERAVGTALDGKPAGLLPATVLAAWDEDGTHYRLEPPSLCVDNACFSLSLLARCEFDEQRREIRLSWATGDGILASVIERIGPSRPTRLAFDSAGRYEDATEAFRTIAAPLGVETATDRE